MDRTEKTFGPAWDPEKEKRIKKGAAITSTLVCAILAFGGGLVPSAALLFFMVGAGYCASAMCSSKQWYSLLAVIPVLIYLILEKNYSLAVLALMIPVVGAVMYLCTKGGWVKTPTVIICSVTLAVVMGGALVMEVYLTCGSIGGEVWRDLVSQLENGWQSYVDEILATVKANEQLALEQYTNLSASEYETLVKNLEESSALLESILSHEIPLAVRNLVPAIVIGFFNAISYLTVTVFHKITKGRSLYYVTVNSEQATLRVKTLGMIIFVICYGISLFTGGYSTVSGAVFTNLYLIYLPAMVVMGVRILFKEGGAKGNMFYIVMMVICLFVNPLLLPALVGFFAAGTTINGKLLAYMEKHKNDGDDFFDR